jgi:putative addiction module component (TIGR02574 family)
MSAAEILEQIRRLPETERREVIERIEEEFIEFEDELTPEQMAELDRRGEQLRRNPASGIPWEQVRAELDRRAEDALKNPGRGTPAKKIHSEIRERLLVNLDGIAESKELTPGEAALIDSRLQDHLDHPNEVVPLEEVLAKPDAKCRK